MPASMTTDEIRAQLADIVHEVCNVPAEDVQLDRAFIEDLDGDSLAMNEIIYEMEDRFGIAVPDEQAKDLHTVGDAVSLIERSLA